MSNTDRKTLQEIEKEYSPALAEELRVIRSLRKVAGHVTDSFCMVDEKGIKEYILKRTTKDVYRNMSDKEFTIALMFWQGLLNILRYHGGTAFKKTETFKRLKEVGYLAEHYDVNGLFAITSDQAGRVRKLTKDFVFSD